MNILYKIMYAILAVMLITFLWPLIKWFIIILLIALVIGFFKLSKLTKTTVYYDEPDYYQNNDQYIDEDNNSDIVIDVEFEEREVKENE